MQSSLDIKIAVAAELVGKGAIPLKELYENLSAELEIPWEEVRIVVRSMKSDGLLSIRKTGKHWSIEKLPMMQKWVDHDMTDGSSSFSSRTAVRITQAHRVDRREWARLMKAFSDGQLDMAFFPADSPIIAYKDSTTKKTVRIDTWTQ